MKEILNWFCGSLNKDRLIKLVKVLKISIPGFTRKIDKAPVQLIRKKFTDICSDAPRDKLMLFLCILNEELHDEISDLNLSEIRDREKELIDKHGLPDYVLGLLGRAEQDEFENTRENIEILIINEQHKEPSREEHVENPPAENNEEKLKEIKTTRKQLRDKNQQIEKLNNQNEKLKNSLSKTEERYKKQLSDLGKAYERKNTELEQLKELFQNMQTQKIMLENQLEEKNANYVQLVKQNEEMQKIVNKHEVQLKIWHAKYPSERLDNKTLRVLFLGDKSNRVINVISGIIIDKTIVNINEAEDVCSKNENIKNYDAAFLLSSRCTFEQRRKILKKFNSCKVKVHEIPNINSSESIVNRMIAELSNNKEVVI